MSERPKFHAQDHGRDNLKLEAHTVEIADAPGRVGVEARAFALFDRGEDALRAIRLLGAARTLPSH